MSTIKTVSLKGALRQGFVLLPLLGMLFGCSLLGPGGSEEGWYIKLNVNHPAGAKAVTVEDFDVMGLDIEIFGPDGESIEEIGWHTEDGSQSYEIPVTEAGQYEIVITHIGEQDGEVVEAEESATFDMLPMVITVINVTPGCIGVIDVSGGGEVPNEEDGTLTVSVADLFLPDDTSVLVGVYEAGVDPYPDPLALIQATGQFELYNGAGSGAVNEPDSDTVWIGTGGSFYDVYVWVDINENLDVIMYPEPGIDLQLAAFPVTVEISGDTVLSLQGSDFVVVPPSP
jgi:hypothetical protein